ncbi:hypothetical protein Syun_008402 [Stephania yunnanensis]|uniref:Smr domain-containing protein n=1 Tax=Stephania yunnanensis TaxID=152371 RepID=A0AAP0KE96_9MAGN
MQISNSFISITKPSNLFHSFTINGVSRTSTTPSPITLSTQLQSRRTETTLEWHSICSHLSAFASTTMGLSTAQNSRIPLGQTLDQSQTLLEQTTAAMLLPRPLDFSGIDDVTEIVRGCVGGELKTISELCAVKRTIGSARAVFEELIRVSSNDDESFHRYSSLLEILQNCDFLTELEQKIGFCVDCNLSVVLDRASEDLEIIRSERKGNMENLESLLKETSTRVFQAGGIDKPLITKRRSRMCVGVRASHRSLLPDGVILDSSSSGVTYFMEPRDAVELNNMEVRLSSSERTEELTVLSLLSSEIAKSESEIVYLLERILELDLASARAAYARWINGVCPVLTQETAVETEVSATENHLSVNIEGIQHPLLLQSYLTSSRSALKLETGNGAAEPESISEDESDPPVPIDIKIKSGTKVVVISGPNAGGKTASMKTLGLASLMSKAGLYLPAKNRPTLPWFDLVLTDIGDHQSLEQNLSTFSGHISHICKILEVTSRQSLVLIDEIGSGTDPSEGVALSASILQYLKDRVGLAVVTTHYADLSRLKEQDPRFENAAMEFCLETLLPTYNILWGSTGNSNALSIAKSIGFDEKVLHRAHEWMEKLMPDKQNERKGMLYESLVEERYALKAQASRAASFHSEVMEFYREIRDEAEDLERREVAIKENETQQIQRELQSAKLQIDEVVRKFDDQIKTRSPDQFNSLIRESEAAIASIVKAHSPSDEFSIRETDNSSYVPQVGEQVLIKSLGNKMATVVEAPDNDGTAMVQYGKVRVRVKKNGIRAIPSRERSSATSLPDQRSLAELQRKFKRIPNEANNGVEASYGPMIQTAKNTVDLRGMRVVEASHHLDMVISASRSKELLFIIHGIGSGVLKEHVLELLKNHPRVAKFEQESPMNYGCTVAYIK